MNESEVAAKDAVRDALQVGLDALNEASRCCACPGGLEHFEPAIAKMGYAIDEDRDKIIRATAEEKVG